MAERQQAVEQRRRVGLLDAESDNVRLAAEGSDEPGGRQIDADAHDLGHGDGAEDAEFHALAHAVRLTRAYVLANERCQRHGKAGHRQEGKALHLTISAAARHGVGTKGVDVGLHNDIGQRDDRVLDAGGQALHDDSLEGRPIKADFPRADGPFFFGAHQLGERQHGADRLGGNGGKCRCANAHAETADQNKVQHDIDDGGRDQVPHGAAAIAHRLQNTRTYVVHDHSNAAHKVHAEVGDGVDQYVVRRAHPTQDLRSKQHTHHRKHRTGGQAQGYRSVDGAAHALPILGTKVAGHHNARAQRHAVDKAGQEKDQTA